MVQVSCGVIDSRNLPLAVRALILPPYPAWPRSPVLSGKSAGRKWAADGVVTVRGPAGRLACAVIATSGFVAARPAELIAGEAVVRADVEEIQGILRKDTTMTAPEIQQEIEQTREHLGETVDELTARADVRARARARAAGVAAGRKDKAAQMSGQMRQSELVRRRWPLAAAAAAATAAVLIGSVLVRRRSKR